MLDGPGDEVGEQAGIGFLFLDEGLLLAEGEDFGEGGAGFADELALDIADLGGGGLDEDGGSALFDGESIGAGEALGDADSEHEVVEAIAGLELDFELGVAAESGLAEAALGLADEVAGGGEVGVERADLGGEVLEGEVGSCRAVFGRCFVNRLYLDDGNVVLLGHARGEKRGGEKEELFHEKIRDGWGRLRPEMRSLIWVWLLMGMVVSCAPLEVAEPLRKEKKVKVPEVLESAEVKKESREVAAPKEKLLTGKLTFSGFTGAGLNEFRVIPETGTKVFVPKNGRYSAVDGFWWRGDRERWFKIPDHAEAWVVSGSGKNPNRFDGSVERDGFSVFWKTLPGLGWASALRGGVSEPGFYPNAGRSRIGVAWPF